MSLKREALEKAVLNALSNAGELFQEAEILENYKKYARAYTLFHLSIEEVGKVFVIFKYLLGNDYSVDQMKKFEKEFRHHKVKINISTNIDVITTWLVKGGELTAEIIENVSYSEKQVDNLNTLKNLSLYSSFLPEGSSFKPTDMIEREDVEEIHLIAQFRIEATSDILKVLLKDLDRFIKIVESLK